MKLFGLEKLSLVDYDGKISATVFTGACNFRCGFCHNSPLVVDVSALTEIDEDEVFSYLNKRKGVLDGICVSGGEPTLNKDLPTFCEKLKKTGLSVKLDTNGTNPAMIKTLVSNALIDYVAMDVKSDRTHYGEVIGIENYSTLDVEKSVSYLLGGIVNYEFRTTIIGGYHTEEIMKNIGEWIHGADKYFLQKFTDRGSCITQNLKEVPYETAEKFIKIVSPFVKRAALRGY